MNNLTVEYWLIRKFSIISVSKNKNKLGKIENDIFIPFSYKPETRSQDISPLYFENGLIYLSRPENICKEDFFGKNIGISIVDSVYAYADIDDEFDFELSLYIYNRFPEKFEYLKKYLWNQYLKFAEEK